MRIFLTSFAITAGLVLATAAVAQGTGSPTGGGGPATSGMSQGNGVTGAGSGAVVAPVGHRQPRAGDVPDEKNDGTAIDAHDAALDRALRSICRGC
jgi:hypothetical protein